MLSPPSPPPPVRPEELLDEYLDHVCAPLVGVLPRGARTDLREEIRGHLEALAEELAGEGRSAPEALSEALREFGEPWRVGEAVLQEASLRPGGMGRGPAPPATHHALAWLGLPAAASLFLLTELTIRVRADLFPLFTTLVILTPLAGGALTGFTAPAGAEAGVRRALAIIGAISAGVALLLLPSKAGLWLLLVEAAYWLPAAWLAARGVLSVRRHYRRTRFLRLAGGTAPSCSPTKGKER